MIGKLVKLIAFAMVASGVTGMEINTIYALICISFDVDKYLSIFDYRFYCK